MERINFGFRNYRSTLTVTGRLPGVYQYSVTNRATSGMVTDTSTIESKLVFIGGGGEPLRSLLAKFLFVCFLVSHRAFQWAGIRSCILLVQYKTYSFGLAYFDDCMLDYTDPFGGHYYCEQSRYHCHGCLKVSDTSHIVRFYCTE